MAADSGISQHENHRVRNRVRPEPLLQLHVLPRRSRSWRSVPSGRPPLRERRVDQPSPSWQLARTLGAEHGRRTASQRRHHDDRSVAHRGAAAPRHRPSGRGAGRPADLRAERNAVDRLAADTRWPPNRRVPVRRQRREPAQRRRDESRSGQPERRRPPRPLQRHRVLRQRGIRLSQQRRTRDDHHRRSGQRRPGSARHAAGARHRRRSGRPHRGDSASAVDAHGLVARSRIGAGVLRRRGYDRSRQAEPSRASSSPITTVRCAG